MNPNEVLVIGGPKDGMRTCVSPHLSTFQVPVYKKVSAKVFKPYEKVPEVEVFTYKIISIKDGDGSIYRIAIPSGDSNPIHRLIQGYRRLEDITDAPSKSNG